MPTKLSRTEVSDAVDILARVASGKKQGFDTSDRIIAMNIATALSSPDGLVLAARYEADLPIVSTDAETAP
jgi:hypothetical protein